MDNSQPQEELTFEEMMSDEPPHQTYSDDEFTCVSESDADGSSNAGGNRKKNNKGDRKGDKTIKYYKNKKIIIEMFPTSDVLGAPIRSASDGIVYTNITVGSSGENLFFKVRSTILKDGVKTYYYSSPEEYERHSLTSVHDDVKKVWSEKYAYTNSILNV
uniref:Uncharacterized protein n=1 Tax=viral metagenome TaxID=1070528 RepID=A0A6C0IKR1_9ZZZZ